jgi:hypothetical protein
MSHGVSDLLPGRVDEAERTYTTTLTLPLSKPRTIHIFQGRPGLAGVEVEGPKLGQRTRDDLTAAVRRIVNLDEDLSEFYALVANDLGLSWASEGAGRMLRTPTVFEAVVKTKRTLVRTSPRMGPALRTHTTYKRFCKCTSSGSSS